MAAELQLTNESLALLVDRFYARVRSDTLIGPLFNQAVHDWPHHLEKLARFWSSVMLGSGQYKGSPVAEHLKHVDSITPEMFERWLALWRETTADVMAPEAAALLQARADRIAESLQLAIRFQPGQNHPAVEHRVPPRSYKPYRLTPVFDQNSLPAALRREHSTKAGTWGVIRLLSGELKLHVLDPPEVRHLSRSYPGVVEPQQPHWVEPIGEMRMRIEFHDGPPVI